MADICQQARFDAVGFLGREARLLDFPEQAGSLQGAAQITA